MDRESQNDLAGPITREPIVRAMVIKESRAYYLMLQLPDAQFGAS